MIAARYRSYRLPLACPLGHPVLVSITVSVPLRAPGTNSVERIIQEHVVPTEIYVRQEERSSKQTRVLTNRRASKPTRVERANFAELTVDRPVDRAACRECTLQTAHGVPHTGRFQWPIHGGEPTGTARSVTQRAQAGRRT